MILRRTAGRRLTLRRRVGWCEAWGVVLAAAVLGGCTGSGGESATGSPLPADRWPPEELTPATPIRVGWVPDGYTLDIAEAGNRPPLSIACVAESSCSTDASRRHSASYCSNVI